MATRGKKITTAGEWRAIEAQRILDEARKPGGKLPDGSSLDHRPSTSKFDFDEQVAKVFPDMAMRSIPNYELAHQIHADFLVQHLKKHQYVNHKLLDVGSSLGAFYDYLDAAIKAHGQTGLVMYRGEAIDRSKPMNRIAADEHPAVMFDTIDLAEEGVLESFVSSTNQYLAINCMYTLQFLKPERQAVVMKLLAQMLVPKIGVLILGTKLNVVEGGSLYRTVREAMHDAYMSFRLRNGYKIEEIVAKSQSLEGVMFAPNETSLMVQTQEASLFELVETTRAMVFSTRIYTRSE